jgi:hypothetical protein
MNTTPTRHSAEERKAQAEALHASILEQVEQLAESGQWRRFLDFARSFHQYSLNNLLLILAQNPDATMVAGYRQWQTKGRQVRKNESDRRRILSFMGEQKTFVAVLLHDEGWERDRALDLPLGDVSTPPVRVRVPTTFAGAAAWDVYELIAAQVWPAQAVYRHIALEPSTQFHETQPSRRYDDAHDDDAPRAI